MKLKTPKKFETRCTAESRQKRLIKQLRKSTLNGTDDLADLLEACLTDDRQCNSGACHLCSRRLRLDLLRELTPFFLQALEAHTLTLILPEFMAPRGQLSTLDLKRIKDRFQRFLRRLVPPNMIFIGSVDVSLNSYKNGDFHWCPHITVLVFKVAPGPSIEDIKPVMRAAVDRLRIGHVPCKVHRPLKVRVVEKGKKSSAATYSFKGIFEWRSGYWKTEKLPRGRAPHRATRGLSLKADDEVEVRQWLAQWTMVNRLILVGALNPTSPNFIRLRPNPRTPQMSKPIKGKRKPKCVVRSKGANCGSGRGGMKRARPRSQSVNRRSGPPQNR